MNSVSCSCGSVLVGLLSLSVLGCSEEPGPARAGNLIVTSPNGLFRVQLTPRPDPIPVNEHFELRVQIEPTGSTVLGDQEVSVDADMPAHGHGLNTKPVVRKIGDGAYEVKGMLFHMSGEWELYVDIGSGGARQRVVFPMNLKL
jgi:hypothetical protein